MIDKIDEREVDITCFPVMVWYYTYEALVCMLVLITCLSHDEYACTGKPACSSTNKDGGVCVG